MTDRAGHLGPRSDSTPDAPRDPEPTTARCLRTSRTAAIVPLPSKMNGFGSTASDEHQPVMWLRGHAVYAAHFIVLVFVGSMLVTTLLDFLHVGLQFEWLPFTSAAVLHGQVWRLFTYGLVNPPSFQFVFDMLMIAWFGRDVERFFGRRTFLFLYACIYLVTPVLFTMIGVWLPMTRFGETGAFALFIAFATIYPEALMMFNVLAKWAALILVGIFTLMALDTHDLTGLITLWATCGFAFAFVRHRQGHFTLPRFRLWRPKPKLRVLPDLPAAKPTGIRSLKADSMAEVDALLDKIARSGLSSLTPKERAKLDSARAEMLKKDSGRS